MPAPRSAALARYGAPGLQGAEAPRQPLDPHSAAILREFHDPRLPHPAELSVDALRRRWSALAKPMLEPMPAEVEDLSLPLPQGAVGARLYRPMDVTMPPVALFLHAGGLVMGDLETHDPFCRLLAHRAGCAVLSLDYTRSPEARFPVAQEQAYETLRWLHRNAATINVDGGRIAATGDSSGGVLASVACRLLGERGDKVPIRCQFLWYPSVGSTSAQPTQLMRQLAEGYILDARLRDFLWRHYLGPGDSPTDPRIQPLLYDDFAGQPPLVVVSAGHDPGTEGHLAYVRRHADAGVAAEFHTAPSTIHAFLMFLGAVSAARLAAEQSADLLAARLR